MTSAIARPLAVALFSTFTCLLAAFAGQTALGLGVAVVGTVTFLVTSRRALLSPMTPSPLVGSPVTGEEGERRTGAFDPGSERPATSPVATPAQLVDTVLPESSPTTVTLTASVGATGSSAAALLHPSGASKVLGDLTSAVAAGQAGEPPVPLAPPGRRLEADAGALTGAGYFAVTLFQRVASSRRALRPLSLVLIEPVGLEGAPTDQVTEALTVLGGVLRATLRECDIACRYSETIAAALLEDTSEEGAIRAVTRLHAALVDGPPRLRNLSISVACYPSHALDARALLERAVEALEYARGSGSGQVEVARAD